jgi:hypothetical protein
MRRIGLVGLVAARCCGDSVPAPWGPPAVPVRRPPVGTQPGRVEFGHGAGDAVCARILAGPR